MNIIDTLAPELVYAIPTDEGVRIGWVNHSRVGGVYSALHILSGHAVICTLTGGQIAMGSCLLTDLAPDVHMIALRAVGPAASRPGRTRSRYNHASTGAHMWRPARCASRATTP